MRVAVIGSGFSGMLASYLLEQEGIDVTIYERDERIGGHCKTIESKNIYTELGTVCSFTSQIKELLIHLEIDYKERFIYRNFVDENYHQVEHMLRENIILLMEELSKLKIILKEHAPYLNDINFGYIPDDLMLSFKDFLKKYNFRFISELIAPFLSSFGFGSIDDVQAYYVFNIFNIDILNSFIGGKKSLFINKGTEELIKKLSQKISDIRYSLEVTNIEVINDKVKVETNYGADYFDKVLITTKLPTNVIKDKLYNQLMKKIDTNPFIACAYEVSNKDLVTTYYKHNLGKKNKIQFFYITKQNNRTILVAYTYGIIEKNIVDGITEDIKNLGIDIKQLITVKQWYIFPHLKSSNLTQTFYKEINDREKISNICLIGSLVSKPTIDNLYVSVKNSISQILTYHKANN
ncbi:FAD-dependent oxidoreductase [uncultured Clostridium sp.]|uniref:FAD-dependent oxidoreductase n=1 Tax=uncultured Clostridium sp. TaxID=59620 RepID=UPI002637ABD3|nr:FAD-dependent oxidoreductase [uncultured Clostridium sp.]